MRRAGWLIAVALLVSATACQGRRKPKTASEFDAGPPVTADEVRVSKAEALASCTFIKMVKGPVDENYLALRNQAAGAGANYVVLDAMETRSGNGFNWNKVRSVMVGRAFNCPDRSEAPVVQNDDEGAPAEHGAGMDLGD